MCYGTSYDELTMDGSQIACLRSLCALKPEKNQSVIMVFRVTYKLDNQKYTTTSGSLRNLIPTAHRDICLLVRNDFARFT